MEAGQTTAFGRPARQTPAVARIKLDMLSVSNPTTAAAALPAGGAAPGAVPIPAAAAASRQPGLTPDVHAAGASVTARVASVEQQLSGVMDYTSVWTACCAAARATARSSPDRA